jgi:hypothetical protein
MMTEDADCLPFPMSELQEPGETRQEQDTIHLQVPLSRAVELCADAQRYSGCTSRLGDTIAEI